MYLFCFYVFSRGKRDSDLNVYLLFILVTLSRWAKNSLTWRNSRGISGSWVGERRAHCWSTRRRAPSLCGGALNDNNSPFRLVPAAEKFDTWRLSTNPSRDSKKWKKKTLCRGLILFYIRKFWNFLIPKSHCVKLFRYYLYDTRFFDSIVVSFFVKE